VFGVDLEPEVNRKIIGELVRANDCKDLVHRLSRTQFRVESIAMKGAVYILDLDTAQDMLKCHCHLVEHGGIPCSHIIAVHRFLDVALDRRYINNRWLRNGDDDPIPAHLFIPSLDTDEENGAETEVNAESSDDEEIPQVPDDDLHAIEADEGENGLSDEAPFGFDGDLEKLEGMPQNELFLTLMFFSKSICSLAARDPGLARSTLTAFREIRNGFYNQSEGSDDLRKVIELEDAIARPKGRPRTAQVARRVAAGLPVNGKKCPICKQNHDVTHCPHFHKVVDVRAQNLQLPVDPGPKRKRCQICLALDHNARTCPHRLSI
jgi:hypothetical protein